MNRSLIIHAMNNTRLNYISFVISKVFTICWEDLENKIVRGKGPVPLILIHELELYSAVH